MSSKYQGVILAAGHGSRMGPFGDEMPKPIAPICNVPLLVYQLEHFKSIGIDDVILVIGHLGHRIAQVLGDGSAYGVRIRYVEQQQRLGLAHANGQLEAHLDAPFVLLLGDMYFVPDDLGQLIRIHREHGVAAVLGVIDDTDETAVKKNYTVHLREDGTVRRVIEKPRHPTTMLRGCGIYLFDLPVFDAIRRTPRTAMRDEYEITDSIQILIDYEYPVRAAEVVQWDMNLTYIADLIACCRHELGLRGIERLVDESAKVHPEARLAETVVGAGAEIRGAVTLERCVVLPGAVLEDDTDYADTVFTPKARFHAKHH